MNGKLIEKFCNNGLNMKNVKLKKSYLFLPIITFILGGIIANLIVAPFVFNFFHSFNSSSIESFAIDFILIFSFGILFSLPILIGLLGKDRYFTYSFISNIEQFKHIDIMNFSPRRLIFFVPFILSAIFTPPDLITYFMWLLLIGIPLIIFIEISFQISRFSNKSNSDIDQTPFEQKSVYGFLALYSVLFLIFFYGLIIKGFVGVPEILFIAIVPFVFETFYVIITLFRDSLLKGIICLLFPIIATYFVFKDHKNLFGNNRFTKVWAYFNLIISISVFVYFMNMWLLLL